MYKHPDFANLFIIDHPLVQHKLTLMRRAETPTSLFRQLLKEVSLLMAYELTQPLPMTRAPIETPVGPMDAPVVAGRKPAIVSILRAGLGMAEGLRELLPSAREGNIGDYRDPETTRPVEYYVKLPEPAGRLFIVSDPMLATGYSAAHAIEVLRQHGVSNQNIRFMALVAAPEGMRVFEEAHPGVHVYAAALDERLDENAYIVPGLGDAGDRLFGTK
ncbi:MAG: uracil phosphoribosyltransferase [Pseudomonadota bacterium]|nr:uracil phosphoribosyltransferase [Pseudomonadota bacterium]